MTFDPTLLTLNRLAHFVEQRADDAGDRLADLGLILHGQLDRLEYWCTPTNALTFGSTGGDGVHFSLVDLGDGPREDSPVVMTVPMAFGDLQPNWIVGSDLMEFLGLGLDTGYFSLEQLAYDERWPLVIAAARGQAQSSLLDDLAAELGVRRWSAIPEHLAVLKARFQPLLQLADEN